MRLTPPTAAAYGPERDAVGIAGARCGTPYDAMLQLPAGLRVLALRIDPGCGLQADPERPGRLHGTPLVAGATPFAVSVRDGRGQVRELQGVLHVSADPRAMWKDLPSDPDAPYPKPALDSQALPGPDGVRLLGASCRGRMHANKGGFRDDDFRLAWLPGRRLLLVAADGAGSAALARQGSRLAVSAVLASIEAGCAADAAADPAILLGNAVRAALAAIEQQAAGTGEPFAAFHTTLLVLLAGLDPPHQVTALQIGDGLVAAIPAASQWSGPLCESDHGEFHGQTRFLTAETASAASLAARLRQYRFEQLARLLVATDGNVDPYFETEAALHAPELWQPYVARLEAALAAAEPLAGLQQWLAEFTPGHHDDRTIAVAAWPG